MGAIYFAIAIIAIICFLCLEWLLDNIIWIGSIVIFVLVITIIHAFPDYKEFGFDFNDFKILLLKLGVIIGIICLMCI